MAYAFNCLRRVRNASCSARFSTLSTCPICECTCKCKSARKINSIFFVLFNIGSKDVHVLLFNTRVEKRYRHLCSRHGAPKFVVDECKLLRFVRNFAEHLCFFHVSVRLLCGLNARKCACMHRLILPQGPAKYAWKRTCMHGRAMDSCLRGCIHGQDHVCHVYTHAQTG